MAAVEDGQPYLVVEYVEGRPITEFCAAQGMGTRERVALFRTVCGAVQYAHQNLVVHRDIKPANVLVDGHGVPKLLDFGIAKLLVSGVDPDLTPTATVLPMMTPEYASPEQVRGQTVTTASDVYCRTTSGGTSRGFPSRPGETVSATAPASSCAGTVPRWPPPSWCRPASSVAS